MTRENVKMNMDIISAFAENKTIQYRIATGVWCDLTESEGLPMGTLEEEPNNFRIKPESKYRPFKDAAECWCEMLKHEPFGWVIRNDYHVNIANLIRQSITFADNEGRNSSFNELLEDCKFADGAKFGIKEV